MSVALETRDGEEESQVIGVFVGSLDDEIEDERREEEEFRRGEIGPGWYLCSGPV